MDISTKKEREKLRTPLIKDIKNAAELNPGFWFFIFLISDRIRTGVKILKTRMNVEHTVPLCEISAYFRGYRKQSQKNISCLEIIQLSYTVKNNKKDCLKLGRRRKLTRLFSNYDRCSISQIYVTFTCVCMLVLVCVHVCIYVFACVCACIYVRNIHIEMIIRIVY